MMSAHHAVHSVPAGGGAIDTKWSDANVARDALRWQAEAKREQAVANRATAQAILAHAQRLGCNDKTADIMPDIVPAAAAPVGAKVLVP